MAEGAGAVGPLLVPMDGSEDSANALALALRLARAYGGRIAALYVAMPGQLTRRKRLPAQAVDEFAEREADEGDAARLTLMPARVWSKTAGVLVDLLAARGDPAEEITEAAKALGAQLIVMGSHGKSAESGGKLLGSVAREVFTTSAIPTIVVPPKAVRDSDSIARDLARESVALPIGPRLVASFDGGPGSEGVAAEAVRLAGLTRGSVHLFSGDPSFPGGDPAVAYNAARAAATKAGVPVSTDSGSSNALEGLLRKAADRDADLVVVGTRAAAGHTHDHLGSFTDRLLSEITCPVEVLRLKPAL